MYRKFFSNPKSVESKKQQSTLAFGKPKTQRDHSSETVVATGDDDGQENEQPVVEGNDDSIKDIEITEAEPIRSSDEENKEKVEVKEEELLASANGKPI